MTMAQNSKDQPSIITLAGLFGQNGNRRQQPKYPLADTYFKTILDQQTGNLSTHISELSKKRAQRLLELIQQKVEGSNSRDLAQDLKAELLSTSSPETQADAIESFMVSYLRNTCLGQFTVMHPSDQKIMSAALADLLPSDIKPNELTERCEAALHQLLDQQAITKSQSANTLN